MKNVSATALSALALACAPLALAHDDGRNFELTVADFGQGLQLAAQGLNFTQATASPGGPIIDPEGNRPFVNAIHDHFGAAVTIGNVTTARAAFPSINTFNQSGTSALEGAALSLELIDGFKFVSPRVQREQVGNVIQPVTVTETNALTRTDLDLNTEDIVVTHTGSFASVSLSNPGALLLTDSFADSNQNDFEFFFDIGLDTTDTIYVLETVLRTTAADVADSEPVFIILSPDGTGPEERLHFESLFAEQQLGTVVPEPSTLALLGAGWLLIRRR